MIRSRDHVARSLEKLIEQFRGRPILQEIVSAHVAQIQTLEDCVWLVLAYRANPIRWWLDAVGALVGRGRNGLEDEDFWRTIQAQILANKSSGNFGTLLDIIGLLSPEGTTTTLCKAFPAGLRLDAIGEYPTEPLRDLLSVAVAAGVRLQMNVNPPGSTAENDRVFRAATTHGTGVAQADALHGAGWTGDPSIGGLASHAVLAE